MGVSEYEDYEPMDVLTGLRKWSQLTIKIVGEKVSDIEDEFEPEEPARKQSLGRKMPYSRKEDKNILTWIVDTGAFTQLKGNEVWKNMAKETKRERENLAKPERTFQKVFDISTSFESLWIDRGNY